MNVNSTLIILQTTRAVCPLPSRNS